MLRMTTARLAITAIMGCLTITTIAVPAAAAATTTPATVVHSSAASTAALPNCDDWSRFNVSRAHYVMIPTVGNETKRRSCVMDEGNQSAGVWVLQLALNECYGQGIAGDSIYGPETKEAVKHAQRKHRIPDDGVFGPQTSRKMVFPKFKRGNGAYVGC